MGVNKIIKIGENIKKIRKNKGLAQKEVAKMLGIPLSTYSNYENDNREPSEETIEKIAYILDVTVSELLGFEVVNINGEIVSMEGEFIKYKEDHKETIGEFRNKLNHLSDKERVKLLSNIFKSKEQKEFLNSLTEEQCNKLLEELSTTVDYLSYKLKNNNK